MKIVAVDNALRRLAELIEQGRFEELETDTLELEPVPADAQGWREAHKSVCAFLNTRGGILIFGVREEGTGPERRYILSGWQAHAELRLKELPTQFTDHEGAPVDLREAFPPPRMVDFLGGLLAVQLVDELPADRKFVFYRREAYRRVVTGDHRVSEVDISRQEEYRREAWQARKLQPVPGVTLDDLDLDKLNDYIAITASIGTSSVYRYGHFSKRSWVSTKMASYSLWYERPQAGGDIKEFDAFYRRVRYVFNRLLKDGFIERAPGTRGYVLRTDTGTGFLRVAAP